MLKGNGSVENSRKSKRGSKNKNVSSENVLYNRYTRPLKHTKIDKIAKAIRVDEYSKKLKLLGHLLTIVHFVIEDCKSLTELCGSLKGKHEKAHDLLYQIIHRYHALQRVSKELLIAGIDTTSIILKAYFSTFGYCASTKTIEQGIRNSIVCCYHIKYSYTTNQNPECLL